MPIIPPMTDPMSKGWSQPSLDEITFYRDKVIMTKRTFDRLKEYSTSIPTGVYLGKMWKFRAIEDVWYLRWFGESSKGSDHCAIYQAVIDLV